MVLYLYADHGYFDENFFFFFFTFKGTNGLPMMWGSWCASLVAVFFWVKNGLWEPSVGCPEPKMVQGGPVRSFPQLCAAARSLCGSWIGVLAKISHLFCQN